MYKMIGELSPERQQLVDELDRTVLYALEKYGVPDYNLTVATLDRTNNLSTLPSVFVIHAPTREVEDGQLATWRTIYYGPQNAAMLAKLHPDQVSHLPFRTDYPATPDIFKQVRFLFIGARLVRATNGQARGMGRLLNHAVGLRTDTSTEGILNTRRRLHNPNKRAL